MEESLDFNNKRGTRLKDGIIDTDAINLGQLLTLERSSNLTISGVYSKILGLESNLSVLEFEAGETLIAKDTCCLLADGKMYRANAGGIATSKGLLAYCPEAIVFEDSGKFIIMGIITLSTSEIGVLYLSTTTGLMTFTPPSGVNQVVRVMGYSISPSKVLFRPSAVWVVNK